jgi:hypothetical protein
VRAGRSWATTRRQGPAGTGLLPPDRAAVANATGDRTLLEPGEWLRPRGREDDAEPLLGEALELFTRLEATPWIQRVQALAQTRV